MAQLVAKLRGGLNTQRRRKRPLIRPPAPQSLPYGSCFYSDDFSPFINPHGLRLKREDASASFVSGLFFVGSPLAVLREVALIIVDSFDAVFGAWSTSHVSEKVIKGNPSLAHRNSTTAVSFVVRSILVATPLFHVCPCIRLASECIKTIAAMTAGLKRPSFSVQAISRNNFSDSANTKTLNICDFSTSKWISNSSQLSKNRSDRCVNLLSSPHDLSLLKTVCDEARQLFSQLFEPPYYTTSLSRSIAQKD